MQKLSGLLILIVLFSAACVSVAELPERARIQAPLPQQIQSVIIRPTTMSPGAIKNVDGLTDAPEFFARSLKSALEAKQPRWQVRIVGEPGDISASDITITTQLANIDGGSAGLRFWIGFSAGAAESTVNATILDNTGRELAAIKISERTMCPIGACVGSNEATVRRNLQSLADEVAEFIVNPAEYAKKQGLRS
jgi:hypothetical protein